MQQILAGWLAGWRRRSGRHGLIGNLEDDVVTGPFNKFNARVIVSHPPKYIYQLHCVCVCLGCKEARSDEGSVGRRAAIHPDRNRAYNSA